MSARVTRGIWIPLAGALPAQVEAETVYVLPTRTSAEDTDERFPLYTDNVRYLPKVARAGGAAVEFSTPANSRRYLQEFSAVEVWALAVAVVSLASDWLIPTIQHFIEIRRQSQGWTTSEAEALPLKVSIAKLDMNAGISETYELEGSGADVMDALNLLSKGDQRRLTDDLEE